jgi:hypothetical protein
MAAHRNPSRSAADLGVITLREIGLFILLVSQCVVKGPYGPLGQ